jgi:hypothetical protein
MEKKHTALAQLLEWVIEFEDKPVKPTLTNMKEKIWQLLPTEREQIEEAYWDGGQDIPMSGQSCKEYYKKTFKP